MYLCVSFLSILGKESIEIGHFTHSRTLLRALVTRRSVGLVGFVEGVVGKEYGILGGKRRRSTEVQPISTLLGNVKPLCRDSSFTRLYRKNNTIILYKKFISTIFYNFRIT
jgi:hypothetical protein